MLPFTHWPGIALFAGWVGVVSASVALGLTLIKDRSGHLRALLGPVDILVSLFVTEFMHSHFSSSWFLVLDEYSEMLTTFASAFSYPTGELRITELPAQVLSLIHI